MNDRDGEPRLVVAPTADVPGLAADQTVQALRAAIEARGVAHWATTGGSAPADVYRELLRDDRRAMVDWDAVHIWWGDDRFVPRAHPLSNVKPLDDILLDAEHGLRIPTEHVHPFPNGEVLAAGLGASACAERLAEELATSGPAASGGWPSFDLVFLGIGADGHLLSVFPGSAAFDATSWTMAIPAPTHIEPHVERVTMHPAIVGATPEVLMVATGTGKAAILADVMGPVRDPRRWPAQLARRDRAKWILDEGAAARLP